MEKAVVAPDNPMLATPSEEIGANPQIIIDDNANAQENINDSATNESEKLLEKEMDESLSADRSNNSIEITSQPTVIEDFVRNFLISHEMHESLDIFQREWYNITMKKQVRSEQCKILEISQIPDVYIQKERLEALVKHLGANITRMESITLSVKSTWNGLRKERDFHRMHHRRVLQEKNDLIKQLMRLKKYCDCFEPMIASLKTKYENAKKDKMLFRISRDKMQCKLDAMEQQIKNIEFSDSKKHTQRSDNANNNENNENTMNSNNNNKCPKPSVHFPVPTHHSRESEPKHGSLCCAESLNLNKTFSDIHKSGISCLALHPSKDNIIATASDDFTWKLWNLPNCELVMSGEGHLDWISSLSFAPNGTSLATCSGDQTIKIWDFSKSACLCTLSDHSSVVWNVAYHSQSMMDHFVVSCSMDHTVKLWDINHRKCTQTYRGHVDSVNFVAFQEYSNNIVSASGDKTISFWDIRSALCIQTFYGHHNSINHVSFNLRGDSIISCDADGVCKIWDVRMIKEMKEINSNSTSCSCVVFDDSAKRAVVACDDGQIKVFDTQNAKLLQCLVGHEEAVNQIAFDRNQKMLMSVSDDCTLRIWQ